MRRVRHQLVILYEIHPRLTQLTYELGSFLRRQANTWLHNGSNDRPIEHASESPCAGNSELWPDKILREGRGKLEIEQSEPGQMAKFKQIASDHGNDGRQIRANVLERKAHAHPAPIVECIGRFGPRRAW